MTRCSQTFVHTLMKIINIHVIILNSIKTTITLHKTNIQIIIDNNDIDNTVFRRVTTLGTNINKKCLKCLLKLRKLK